MTHDTVQFPSMPTPDDIFWSPEDFMVSETMQDLPHTQLMKELKRIRKIVDQKLEMRDTQICEGMIQRKLKTYPFGDITYTLKKKRAKSLVTPYETSSFRHEIEQAIGNPEIVARVFKIIAQHRGIIYEFKQKYTKDDIHSE